MQTFLPEPDFNVSARVLDYRRLGKQRVEAKQILSQLVYGVGGFPHHPVNDMWRGYEDLLAIYGLTMCDEWVDRGYVDNLWNWFWDIHVALPGSASPPWLGDEAFHDSHRSNLYRKDPVYYARYAYLGPDLPYMWPRGCDV